MSKAPKSFVMTGYHLEKAVRKYIEYLWTAVECLGQAVRDAKSDGKDINLMDLHKEREMIFAEMANAQNILKVHKRLARKSEALDYDKITDEDFSEFGAGTNR